MLAERFAKSTATAARRKRTRATMSSDSQRGKASLKPAASAAKRNPIPSTARTAPATARPPAIPAATAFFFASSFARSCRCYAACFGNARYVAMLVAIDQITSESMAGKNA